jgi:hypothetical protein
MIKYLYNIYHNGDEEETELLNGFIDYPIYFKKVKNTELKKSHKQFIKCLKTILKMKSFPRPKFQSIDIEDFLNNYQEPDYDY